MSGLVGIGRNVTQRVEAARALDVAVRESREVIHSVLAGAVDRRVAVHDKSGNLQQLARLRSPAAALRRAASVL